MFQSSSSLQTGRPAMEVADAKDYQRTEIR